MTRQEAIYELGSAVLARMDEVLPGDEVFGSDDADDPRLNELVRAVEFSTLGEVARSIAYECAPEGE